MYLVSSAQMRELDRLTIDYGTPGHVLMERAGEGACELLLREFPHVEERGAKVVVVAGKGNNGGDGFVVARLLAARGIATSVVLLARAAEVAGDAGRNLHAYAEAGGAIVELSESDRVPVLVERLAGAACVVDALLGTGLRREVTGLQADAIEAINTCGAPVLAVDVPSGLDSDSGYPLGTAIQAEATATFAFAKLGQVVYPGARYCGRLAVVDIGLDERAIAAQPPRARLIDEMLAAALTPYRAIDAHKGNAGHLLVVAGGLGKSGAAVLATRGALRSGAGLVTLATPESVRAECAVGAVEAMTEPLREDAGGLVFDEERWPPLVEGRSAAVVGPGLGTGIGARRVVRWLLAQEELALVVDADALNVLAGRLGPLRRAKATAVLTPHPGEMARLAGIDTGAVQRDRVAVARGFAEKHRCVVVLKGARTVVAAPDGMVWINPTGNPGMASGGMGDVLAGAIGGFLAQGLPAAEAACLGVFVHGAAADRCAGPGAIGILASDVAAAVPAVLGDLGDTFTV